MADITKITTPSLASSLPCPAHQVLEGRTTAGEAIGAGDVCYVKASDGLVYKATGAAANEAARAWGIAPAAAATGNPITLFRDIELTYSTGMTIGTPFFVSATAGALADAASTGGTTRVAYAISATAIRFKGDL
jgi:hypothetical protein